jgi:hypothetical protein
MTITYDPAKRDWTLRERKLDFEDAKEVFVGRVLQRQDDRHDYGEIRIITIGFLRGRMVVVAWTPRGDNRHVISMRKANDREKARYNKEFESQRE